MVHGYFLSLLFKQAGCQGYDGGFDLGPESGDIIGVIFGAEHSGVGQFDKIAEAQSDSDTVSDLNELIEDEVKFCLMFMKERPFGISGFLPDKAIGIRFERIDGGEVVGRIVDSYGGSGFAFEVSAFEGIFFLKIRDDIGVKSAEVTLGDGKELFTPGCFQFGSVPGFDELLVEFEVEGFEAGQLLVEEIVFRFVERIEGIDGMPNVAEVVHGEELVAGLVDAMEGELLAFRGSGFAKIGE